jgi:formyl-CoA transferase
MESMLPEFDRFGVVRERTGSILPGIAPTSAYRCADGAFVLIAANGDSIFQRLCAARWAAPISPPTRRLRTTTAAPRGSNARRRDRALDVRAHA